MASICQAKNWMDTITDFVDDTSDVVVDLLDKNQETIDTIRSIAKNMPKDIQEVQENAEIVVDYFKNSIILDDYSKLPVKNSTCITRHCMGQITACIGDETCRTNMLCSGNCGPHNTTCTFYCSESYQTPVADDMLSCLYVDHGCLSLPPPDPINNATCRNPTEIVESVDDE